MGVLLHVWFGVVGRVVLVYVCVCLCVQWALGFSCCVCGAAAFRGFRSSALGLEGLGRGGAQRAPPLVARAIRFAIRANRFARIIRN